MDDKTRQHFEEYTALSHQMQSAVATLLTLAPEQVADAKHLRVGINCALSEVGALGRLLIDKGVFTEDEYWQAMKSAMKSEVEAYKHILSEKMGVPVERINLI